MTTPKVTNAPTSVVRISTENLESLRAVLQPLGAETDKQLLQWSIDVFLQIVHDENDDPTIPPIAAIARGYIKNGLPKLKKAKK